MAEHCLGIEGSRPRARERWGKYLDEFHGKRPGITEDILNDATGRGSTPYRWLLDALPSTGAILDLACGSAPTYVQRPRWVGVDRSAGELGRAARRGVAPLVRADAAALPLAAAAFDAVICSMAIMLLQPLGGVLAELRRVLTEGGTAAFLLPGSRPLAPRELLRYGQLMVAVRRGHLAYPNDRALFRLERLAGSIGFEIVDDRRRRFTYPLPDEAAAGRFVASLYLPSTPERRRAAATRVAQRWVGTEMGIPLRRVVLQAT